MFSISVFPSREVSKSTPSSNISNEVILPNKVLVPVGKSLLPPNLVTGK